MNDLDEKYRERWRDRRKRAYNWKKLLIMVLALAALLILMNRLNRVANSVPQAPTEFIDSTAVYGDSLPAAVTP